MHASRPCIVWFRNDLRLHDNPALSAALTRQQPILPLFIWTPQEEGAWPPGGATRWWLHHSLTELDASLRQLGSRLLVRDGSSMGADASLKILTSLAAETGADAVYWNRRYEVHAIARDKEIKEKLRALPLEVESYKATLLFEPWEIKNRTGGPYKVFTPFWRECLQHKEPDAPLPTPREIQAPTTWPQSDAIDSLKLLPKIPWDSGLRAAWKPGEAMAFEKLQQFCDSALSDYPVARDVPNVSGTSSLSAHLHFGEISPRVVWHKLREQEFTRAGKGIVHSIDIYLKEIGWREFAYHLLYHFPNTTNQPLRPEFAKFPWRSDAKRLRAWHKGETGYPIVDAGLRQLWQSGWMHNRVRMLVASFLVKDLLIDWREGAAWFWDTLVDADLANNTLGWQWSAGSGADAAPYFRIFNPTTQGERFDPEGTYVRRWVPELQTLPKKWIHAPWKAPESVLKEAGIVLGKNYPAPIVDHGEARDQALTAFAQLKQY